MGTFFEMPVYHTTLAEMDGVNNGRIFAIDKAKFDAIFSKHDRLWANDRRVYGSAVIFSECDKRSK